MKTLEQLLERLNKRGLSIDPPMVTQAAKNVKNYTKDIKHELMAMKGKHSSQTTKRAANAMLKKMKEVESDINELLKKID